MSSPAAPSSADAPRVSADAPRVSGDATRVSADAAGRRTTVVVAGHTGDIDTVRAHRMDPDVGVRRGVISALVRLGELNLHELVSALDDSGTARRAIELSAHNFVGTMSVDARLAAFASGDDDDLAELAVWALGERWQEQGERSECAEVLDVVEHATRHHRDALVREAAVAALGSIGAQRSIPVIIAAGSDKATVRRRAVIALAPFDGPDVDAALRGALNDRDWQVRQAAEDLTVPPPS